MANIQWFPGHMNKTRRLIEENIKNVDVVVELLDARVPFSSANPLLNSLIGNKKRLFILNKSDLADEKINMQWINHFKLKGYEIIALNSLKDNLNEIIVKKVKEIGEDILNRAIRRGIKNKVLKIMIVGIPNVGKSSFINKIIKKSVTKTENRPGVTKNINWIRIHKDVDLLDTPGILWPSFENENIGLNLALVGSIKQDVLDKERLAYYALDFLKKNYFDSLKSRYGEIESDDNDEIFKIIGRNKNIITVDSEIDYNRIYDLILTDVKNNNLGNISYEKPD